MYCKLILILCLVATITAEEIDDDFAEFNTYDENEFEHIPENSPQSSEHSSATSEEGKQTPEEQFDDSEEVTIATEDEFDDQEFEGEAEGILNSRKKKANAEPFKPLQISDVPQHLRNNWECFYLEIAMLAGLSAYAFNYFYGKTKNQKLASSWMEVHKDILDKNFALVGDDGQGKEPQSGILMKESDNLFSLWCSGRVGCESMMIDLKFVKRQDIISLISRIFRPLSDMVEVNITMSADEMDSVIFALGTKKSINKAHKECIDLSSFCDSKRTCEKHGFSSFYYVSELPDVANFILDSQMMRFLKEYPSFLEYMHISDQYSGVKPTDDSQPQIPTTKRIINFKFNLPKNGRCQVGDMSSIKPTIQLVIYFIDKIRKFKLSKDLKAKADKNRLRMEDAYSKLLHTQRQEAAQQKKDEKRRLEKERIMNEEDPEKQRKLEEQQLRKEKKKSQPKMKSMVVRMK